MEDGYTKKVVVYAPQYQACVAQGPEGIVPSQKHLQNDQPLGRMYSAGQERRSALKDQGLE